MGVANLLVLCCVCLSLNNVSSKKIALLIIDVQNCFLPGGSLAVTEGDHVIPVINQIRAEFASSFSLVVLSQDWHCSDHVSFASQHQNINPFQEIQLLYDKSGSLCDSTHNCSDVTYNLTQMLWPDHCIMNTPSANFSVNLTRTSDDVIIRKGYDCEVDSYSAFYDNGKFRRTELDAKLKSSGIDTVFITGLARDYCVYYTSMDAKILGYDTYVVLDATRPVSADTGQTSVDDMTRKGIRIIQSNNVQSTLEGLTSSAMYWTLSNLIVVTPMLISIPR